MRRLKEVEDEVVEVSFADAPGASRVDGLDVGAESLSRETGRLQAGADRRGVFPRDAPDGVRGRTLRKQTRRDYGEN